MNAAGVPQPLGFPQGRGFDDGKPYSAHGPFRKVPAARGKHGREEALRRIPWLSPRTHKAAAEEGGEPMLKSALEGLKGRRSRHELKSGVRAAGWAFNGSDIFRLPKHLYPPRRR